MFLFSKRERIIKKAVAITISEFSDRTPRIYQHLFYGAFDLAPQYLVVWYLFETNTELETAKTSGYCEELERATTRNLIALGYPKEAFETAKTETPKIEFRDGTEKNHKKTLHSRSHGKAMILFTTKEDIDQKANGNYYLYFK